MDSTLYEGLLLASVVVFVTMVIVYLRSGRASMFHPVTVFLALHFIVFVARPFLVYYREYNKIYEWYDFSPTFEDKCIVLLGANLSLVVFVLACLHFGRARPRLAQVPERQINEYVKPVLLTCVILGIPGLWSLYTVLGMTSLGTVQSQWVMDPVTGNTINTTSNGYLLDSQLMLATLAGMFAYVFRFRWWSLLPFLAFVLLRAGTGGRGPFISATLFIILLYLFYHRRKWLTASSIALSLFALALFRVVGDYRSVGFKSLFAPDTRAEVPEDMRFLESMDWANLEFFEYLVYTIPQRTGTYDYFASLLQLFTEPIPRVLWADKPIGAPVKFFNLLDYGTPYGMTYSLPGSGWVELGWAGIVIMSVAFAWIYGKAYDRFMGATQTPFTMMLYCALAMSSIVAYRDGLILTIARQSLFYLAPVLMMQLLAKGYGIRSPASSREPVCESRGDGLALARTPRERRRERAAGLDGA